MREVGHTYLVHVYAGSISSMHYILVCVIIIDNNNPYYNHISMP